MSHPVTMYGPDLPTGIYILHLLCQEDIAVSFGRFQEGAPIHIPSGRYLYIGSAMGLTGASTLPNRLLRHASRTSGKPPHPIRADIAHAFHVSDAPRTKTLHWHIDYLLDHNSVNLQSITALRTSAPLESTLAARLNDLPQTKPLAPGLGASDFRNGTHLLRVKGEVLLQNLIEGIV